MENIIGITDFSAKELDIYARLTEAQLLNKDCPQDGLDAVIELHKHTSGIRDLEQAAEHLAANALYPGGDRKVSGDSGLYGSF